MIPLERRPDDANKVMEISATKKALNRASGAGVQNCTKRGGVPVSFKLDHRLSDVPNVVVNAPFPYSQISIVSEIAHD